MKRKEKEDDVTTRVDMNPSTFYRFAIVAMLKRFSEGDDI